jgi:hypothetical protein
MELFFVHTERIVKIELNANDSKFGGNAFSVLGSHLLFQVLKITHARGGRG